MFNTIHDIYLNYLLEFYTKPNEVIMDYIKLNYFFIIIKIYWLLIVRVNYDFSMNHATEFIRSFISAYALKTQC